MRHLAVLSDARVLRSSDAPRCVTCEVVSHSGACLHRRGGEWVILLMAGIIPTSEVPAADAQSWHYYVRPSPFTDRCLSLSTAVTVAIGANGFSPPGGEEEISNSTQTETCVVVWR